MIKAIRDFGVRNANTGASASRADIAQANNALRQCFTPSQRA